MFNSKRYRSAIQKRIPRIINLSADIVVDDIKSGITYGRDIEGSPFKPLKPATIKAKRKSGSKTPRIALSDKEVMKKTYKKRATANNLTSFIQIAKSRLDPNVAKFQHEGKGDLPVRKWFGISATASKRIKKLIRQELLRELRNSWGMR